MTSYEDGVADNYTEYQYDAAGNKTGMYTGMSTPGAYASAPLTQYAYDRFGNMTELTDALGNAESYTYDLSGNMLTKIDRNGAETVYTYDGLNRVLTSTVTDGGEQTGYTAFIYTKTGQKAAETDGAHTVSFAYDALGRLLTQTETGGTVKDYTYDAGSNKLSASVTAGGAAAVNTAYTYDVMSRLVTVTENNVTTAEYTYDINGNRATMSYGNGNSVTYEYNLANMVTGVTNLKGATVVSSYAYTYYLDGNQRTKTDHTGKVTTYVYDGQGRLKSESESGFGAVYAYDLNGNRATMTVTGASAYTSAYTYDRNNRLVTETKSAGGTDEITEYYYDRSGNTLARMTSTLSAAAGAAGISVHALGDGGTGAVLYEYDGYNRQTRVRSSDSDAEYTYRPDGLRHSKTVDGVTTTHVWDGQNIVLDMNGTGAVTAKYIRGVNLIAAETAGARKYYLYNAHGDVVNLTDTTGTSVKSYDYDAFGVEKNPDANDANPWRYCGEYFDTETKTIYLRARYYDPVIGRFTTQDGWEYGNDNDPLSLNLYTYAHNNPLRYADPCGNDIILVNQTTNVGWGPIGPFGHMGALVEYEGVWYFFYFGPDSVVLTPLYDINIQNGSIKELNKALIKQNLLTATDAQYDASCYIRGDFSETYSYYLELKNNFYADTKTIPQSIKNKTKYDFFGFNCSTATINGLWKGKLPSGTYLHEVDEIVRINSFSPTIICMNFRIILITLRSQRVSTIGRLLEQTMLRGVLMALHISSFRCPKKTPKE